MCGISFQLLLRLKLNILIAIVMLLMLNEMMWTHLLQF